MIGLIILCAPALGRMATFRTRFSTMWIQEIADTFGWKGHGVMSKEVLEELRFWRDNVDKYNGQLIRKAAGVVRMIRFWGANAGRYIVHQG